MQPVRLTYRQAEPEPGLHLLPVAVGKPANPYRVAYFNRAKVKSKGRWMMKAGCCPILEDEVRGGGCLANLLGYLGDHHVAPRHLRLSHGDGLLQDVGQIRALESGGQSTTTIDQVALAFTAPSNLPPAKVYEQAIIAEL